MRNFLKYYGITFLVATVVFVGFAATRGLFTATDALTIYTAISDGAALAGILSMATGSLIYVSGQGVFDAISYSFNRIAAQFVPGVGLLKPKEDYYEYITKKHTKPIKVSHLIYVGLFYTIIAIVFTVLYINIKG